MKGGGEGAGEVAVLGGEGSGRERKWAISGEIWEEGGGGWGRESRVI